MFTDIYSELFAIASSGLVVGGCLGCIVIIIGYVVRFTYRMISGREEV